MQTVSHLLNKYIPLAKSFRHFRKISDYLHKVLTTCIKFSTTCIKFQIACIKFQSMICMLFSFLLKVNGINLLKLHAGNVLAYGRMLLDVLFTRSELKDTLLFASKKREKPAFDRKKLELEYVMVL